MSQFLGWTKEKVEYLKQHGRVRGYLEKDSSGNLKNNSHNQVKNIPARSKQKEWLSWNLAYWCNEKAVTLEEEYKFDEQRKFRFDFCIKAYMIAVEYEGMFRKDNKPAAHTSISGIKRDIEKYNLAQQLGWRIIRINAANYKTVLQLLNAFVK